jgi:transcription initiation factor IIE alpha subunit
LRNKWNSIARELYILSEKKFIKTPKQCRERWLNYLDPSKVHSPWAFQEDLILLSSIRDNGKRWAYTVKKLLKKRTEHMVKNRFNSLINNEKKKIGNKS